jgi:eukaryotic-like serine/threonine-protein kinase
MSYYALDFFPSHQKLHSRTQRAHPTSLYLELVESNELLPQLEYRFAETRMIILIGSSIFDHEGNSYEIIQRIGEGAFGVVFKARVKSSGEVFAVKTLQTSYADKATFDAFAHEGKLASNIRHKNVIQYIYFHDGSTHVNLSPYIIMEWAEGGTLYSLMERKKSSNSQFANDELMGMFSQLIEGMEAINSKLIHRDIKPDNILISHGTLKISDFGLCKVVSDATRTSTLKGMGCIPYMAPEAWKSEKNTIAMDIYSMGIVFYQLATAQHPLRVERNDAISWERVHLYQNPVLPNTINKTDLPPVYVPMQS